MKKVFKGKLKLRDIHLEYETFLRDDKLDRNQGY